MPVSPGTQKIEEITNHKNSEEEQLETVGGFRIAKERIKVKFKAVPKQKEYVREVDEQTYRKYRQKFRVGQARKEQVTHLTQENYEREFKQFKQRKIVEYVERLDFVKVPEIKKQEDAASEGLDEDEMEDHLLDNRRETEQMKFRDLYMDEVYKNIDQYRIDALKKISMEKFDEV